MNFEDLLLKVLQIIRDSDVPLSRNSIVNKLKHDVDDEILINVFEQLEDEHLADYFLKGYVIAPSGRDYLRRSKTFSSTQARLDFSEGF